MYPIRCAVNDLKLTVSQKKVIKRVNRYLNYDQRPKSRASSPDEQRDCPQVLPSDTETAKSGDADSAVKLPESLSIPKSEVTPVSRGEDKSMGTCSSGDLPKKSPKPGLGHYSSSAIYRFITIGL